ncbi:uncharacterized protein [Leptinotarsa decemlineata]|uniref:uncharacterized protein n=1 Tax=Leptinotarsa decemlineata TaxID=7539 RepID=UPI003D30B4B9
MYFEHILVFLTISFHRISGSPLNGPCASDDDCGTIDTYCKNQTCVCAENFGVWYDSCVQLSSPAVRCKKKTECHNILGVRSMCTKKFQCACKPFHHLHMGQCVKNRDLDEMCEHDHQCYCGAGCEERIACIHKNCTCKPGHKPYRTRRCIDDPSFVITPKENLVSPPISIQSASTSSATSVTVLAIMPVITNLLRSLV